MLRNLLHLNWGIQQFQTDQLKEIIRSYDQPVGSNGSDNVDTCVSCFYSH